MKRRNFLGALASLPLFGLVAPKEKTKEPKWNKRPVDMVFEDNHWKPRVGGKVSILTHGWVVARCKDNPQPGEIAYYDSQGWITNKSVSKPIGYFLSSKDEDGFVKVSIQI